jgi:hypothetical protein
MSVEEQHTVVERHYGEPSSGADGGDVVSRREVVTARPTAVEMLRRVAILAFGLVQLAIVLRILLLLIGAREGAPIVAWILDVSQPLVAPFDGILRQNALQASGSVVDLAAIAAFVGWTILEAIVLAVIGLFGRDA